MPRVRSTVRGMMIAVAVIAVALIAAQRADDMLARRSDHRQRASRFAALEERHRVIARAQSLIPGYQDYARKSKLRQERYGAMRRNHERAARYPWLPVAPDPPEPD